MAVISTVLMLGKNNDDKVLWYDSPDGYTLLLKGDDQATLSTPDGELNGTWKLERQTLELENGTVMGQFSQGVVTLMLDGKEISFTNHSPEA